MFPNVLRPEPEIHNDKFILREVYISCASISNQFGKPPARKLSVFPHAKPHFRRDEPISSNIERAPRPVLKQFRQFQFFFRRHYLSCSAGDEGSVICTLITGMPLMIFVSGSSFILGQRSRLSILSSSNPASSAFSSGIITFLLLVLFQ
jgi:hypothetical protein